MVTRQETRKFALKALLVEEEEIKEAINHADGGCTDKTDSEESRGSPEESKMRGCFWGMMKDVKRVCHCAAKNPMMPAGTMTKNNLRIFQILLASH